MDYIGNLALAIEGDQGSDQQVLRPGLSSSASVAPRPGMLQEAEEAARRLHHPQPTGAILVLGGAQLQAVGTATTIGLAFATPHHGSIRSAPLRGRGTPAAFDRRWSSVLSFFPETGLAQPSRLTTLIEHEPRSLPMQDTRPESPWMESPPYLALARDLIRQDNIEAARRLVDSAPFESDTSEFRRLRILLSRPKLTPIADVDSDRTREYASLSRHWPEYQGQWVAVDGDEIVATGATLADLRDRLRVLHLSRRPLVHRIR